jgi:hypothetical protein
MKAMMGTVVIGIGMVMVGMAGHAQASGLGTAETITGYGPYQFGIPLQQVKGEADCRPDTIVFRSGLRAMNLGVPGIVCNKKIQVAVGITRVTRPGDLTLNFVGGHLVSLDLMIHDTNEGWPNSSLDTDLWWAVRHSLDMVYSERLVTLDDDDLLIIRDRQGNELVAHVSSGGSLNPKAILVTYTSTAAHRAAGGF